MKKALIMFIGIGTWLAAAGDSLPGGQDGLSSLAQRQYFVSKRISSYDRTGGNKDSLSIKPGETATLAEIAGPGAIHHLWVTIAAEPFYGRKIVLRMFWDGEKTPSVEAPIGDFFGVGHGLNRNFSSLPLANSSDGRAKNCYWPMPFRKSARITATNEGTREVAAFYYYVDYRLLSWLGTDTPYFHAQFRQETPCAPGANYLLLDARGRGHYVGCNLSVIQKAMGWWGEGDDMIYVDGEDRPSLHGTGSEDYFSDAWGMRQDENLFYGCPLQEEDFQAGSKATVYRFHIPDPITFDSSIRVTIEHGHANDRSDDYSSTAYWYQTEPHKDFPPLPPVKDRLPFAWEPPTGFILPKWEALPSKPGASFEDRARRILFKAESLTPSLTPYYGPAGDRYPVLLTEGLKTGGRAELSLRSEVAERVNLDLYFLKGPAMGDLRVAEIRAGNSQVKFEPAVFRGFSKNKDISVLSVSNVLLAEGTNAVILQAMGKDEASQGMDLGFVGHSLSPVSRQFVTEWNLIGPFDAPDMDSLAVPFPPETETRLDKSYPGKTGVQVRWRKTPAEPSGYVRLAELVTPNEQAVAYALAYVLLPKPLATSVLLGSDDGVRVWINGALVHSNPAYRGASPDQDIVKINLKAGWNKVLVKVLQGAGGWGFYFRLADPDGRLTWALEPRQ